MRLNDIVKHIIATMLILGGMVAWTVMADYQDPLDSPALMKSTAVHSLLLDVAQAGDRLVAVGERGHILTSDDQGQNWTQQPSPVRSQLTAVHFFDDNNGWIVGADALILYSADGGLTWTKQFDDRDADIRGPLLDIYFTGPTQGFAVGVYNKFYRTEDGGNTWTYVPQSVDNLDEWHLLSIGVCERRLYITSESGLLFVSEDGGESFAPLQTDHIGSFHGMLCRDNSDGIDELVVFGVGGKLFTLLNGSSNGDGSDTDLASESADNAEQRSVDQSLDDESLVDAITVESWTEIDTGIPSGLADGTWLEDGSALLVGADGVILRGNPSLTQWETSYTDSGLPITSVMNINGKNLVTSFGTQIIE